jgi:4'-phosphopantetheinyl transferase
LAILVQNAMLTPFWQLPPTQLRLTATSLHLWQAPLDTLTEHLPRFWESLNPEEQARAKRFAVETHRRRFIVARGMLRYLLERYTHIPAPQILLTYGAKGKPQYPGLEFNLSHSQGLGLYVFANLPPGPVGVDLEYLRPMSYLTQLSQRYFSARELTNLVGGTPEQQIQQFFRLWTSKEAYLKATGEGISQLQQIEVLPTTTGALQLYPRPDDGMTNLAEKDLAEKTWQLLEFCPCPGYQAALAYPGNPCQVQFWQAEQLS